MKVIGTGSPRMLTIRFEACELEVLRDELEQRRSAILEAIAHAQQQQAANRSSLLATGRSDPDVARRDDELLLISQLLDELRQPAPRDQPRELVAPTWLLGDVIRGATGEAIERLVGAVTAFCEDRGTPTAAELGAASATAAAWVQTLIGLDYAQNHAVED